MISYWASDRHQIRPGWGIRALAVDPNLLEFVLRPLEYDHRRFAVLPTLMRQPNCGRHCLALNREHSLQIVKLDRPLSLALENDELDEQTHLAKSAEKPDEKDDWEWYANQPEQKTSTHSLSPPNSLIAQANVASGFEFHPRQQSAYRSIERRSKIPASVRFPTNAG